MGNEDGKLLALRQLIQKGLAIPALLFVQSKERAIQLFHELVYDNINVDMIHAERTQAQRSTIIQNFRAGKIWVLVCTDLMARGIDFKNVNCVINYDFPQSTAQFIHRLGRTGRAGRSGLAFTFFTEQDKPLLRAIASVMKWSGCEIPDWMLGMHKISTKTAKKLQEQAPARKPISTATRDARKAEKEKRSQKRRKTTHNEGPNVKKNDKDKKLATPATSTPSAQPSTPSSSHKGKSSATPVTTSKASSAKVRPPTPFKPSTPSTPTSSNKKKYPVTPKPTTKSTSVTPLTARQATPFRPSSQKRRPSMS